MDKRVHLKNVSFDKLFTYINPQAFFDACLPLALWSMLRVRHDPSPIDDEYPISKAQGNYKVKFICSDYHPNPAEAKWTSVRGRCQLTYQIFEQGDGYVVRHKLVSFGQKCRTPGHPMVPPEAQLSSIIKWLHRFIEGLVCVAIKKPVISFIPREIYLTSGQTTPESREKERWNYNDISNRAKPQDTGRGVIQISWWNRDQMNRAVAENDRQQGEKVPLHAQDRNRDNHDPDRCQGCLMGICDQESDNPQAYSIRRVSTRRTENELLRSLLLAISNQRRANRSATDNLLFDPSNNRPINNRTNQTANTGNVIRRQNPISMNNSVNTNNGVIPRGSVNSLNSMNSGNQMNSMNFLGMMNNPLDRTNSMNQTNPMNQTNSVNQLNTINSQTLRASDTTSYFDDSVYSQPPQAPPVSPSPMFVGSNQLIGGSIQPNRRDLLPYNRPSQVPRPFEVSSPKQVSPELKKQSGMMLFLKLAAEGMKRKLEQDKELQEVLKLSRQEHELSTQSARPAVNAQRQLAERQTYERSVQERQLQDREAIERQVLQRQLRASDLYSDDYLFEDPKQRPKPDSDYPDYYLFQGLDDI